MTDLLPRVTEQQRLAVLDSYNILDTSPEAGFDDIVTLAREITRTPVALVSLVAGSRQWFKAASGTDMCETPIEQSVCAHVIRQDNTLVIPDLTKDERTKANTLVTGEPRIRFYAGAILRTPSGIPLGTVCVLDTKVRPEGLSAEQIAGLEALARMVMMQLEQRRIIAGEKQTTSEQRTAIDVSVARAVESERLNVMLKASEARLRTAQEAGEIGTFDVDIPTNVISVTEEFCKIFGLPYRPSFDMAIAEALVHPDDKEKISNTRQRQDGKLPQAIEYRIRKANTGETVWISRRAQIIRDDHGTPMRFVGAVLDITERKQSEERQRVLNDELSHRLKNTLALVQAIARQTLRGASDRGAVDAFEQRVGALSRAHDVLLQQSWAAADMRGVLEGVLGLHSDVSRFSFDGPRINLGPKAALSLSLLLHELATNAVKYGALSVPAGRVEVVWAKQDDDLVLTWRELGGPPPAAEAGKAGLGTRLITMGLLGTGRVVRRYDPSGLFAEFRAPLATVEETAAGSLKN
jgi:PAS domain S-box-containing protein